MLRGDVAVAFLLQCRPRPQPLGVPDAAAVREELLYVDVFLFSPGVLWDAVYFTIVLSFSRRARRIVRVFFCGRSRSVALFSVSSA